MSRRLRPAYRQLRGHVLAAAARLAAALVAPLPLAAVQRAGAALGTVAWWLGGRSAARSLEHLALAFPDRPEAERRRLARAAFRHLGTTALEVLWLRSRSCADLEPVVEVSGWEIVERSWRERRPILFVTGHCGNWELMPAVVSCRGLPVTVVVRALDEPPLQRLAEELRHRFGTRTVDRGAPGAARELLRALRAGRDGGGAGGGLGMLIDQDTRVDGVWVPFFGRPAYTPVGAAKIAARRDVSVVPVFTERLASGRHRIVFHPPLELPDDETAVTARLTEAIEAQIRRVPEQWVWMHRRWRRRPPGES